MFDFAKIELPKEYATSLLSCDTLNFNSKVSHQTGELDYHYKKAVYPDKSKHPLLTFTIRGQHVEMTGSLHKFYHNGKNHNNYTYTELIATIKSLQNTFGINPNDAIIHNLEIGANLSLSFCKASEFVANCMLHSTKSFSLELFEGRGKLKRFCYSQYDVKAYDKSLQYQLSNDVFRFEKKLKKMESFGFVTLQDLTKYENVEKAKIALKSVALDLIVSEPNIKKTNLSKPQKRLVINWENPNYLEKLAKTNPKKLKYERLKYRQIVAKHCTKSIFQDFINNLEVYLSNYQCFNPKTYTNLTNIKNKKVHHIDSLNIRSK